MDFRAKNTISLTEARKRIFNIAEDVQKPGTFYSLTEKGRAKAVILSAQEFESLMETIETFDCFPDIEKDIEQGKKEISQQEIYTLEEAVNQEDLALADKPRKKNAPGNSNQNRKKRSR